MGTRADFYIGRGESAEWLGSIAFDGYPDGIPTAILTAGGGNSYRLEVENFLASRDDATLPGQGWPWPWDDSSITDYAYAFDGDKVYIARFGYQWCSADKTEDLYPEIAPVKECVFPKMSERKNVAAGRRSGMMMVTVRDGRFVVE